MSGIPKLRRADVSSEWSANTSLGTPLWITIGRSMPSALAMSSAAKADGASTARARRSETAAWRGSGASSGNRSGVTSCTVTTSVGDAGNRRSIRCTRSNCFSRRRIIVRCKVNGAWVPNLVGKCRSLFSCDRRPDTETGETSQSAWSSLWSAWAISHSYRCWPIGCQTCACSKAIRDAVTAGRRGSGILGLSKSAFEMP